jgi:hypothetical protein
MELPPKGGKSMKRLQLILLAGVLSSVLGGCLVSGTVRTRAYVEPELVYVSPGVQVVYDYDEPVFYSEGYYWRYYGGVWYRSGYHNHGWVRWRNVPYAVVHVDNPHGYVHYRGRAGARRERARVRDNRREERREIRQDRREERREDRREKVQDKRERKQEKRHDKNEDRGRVKVRDHR